MDETILPVIEALGPDFTVEEWAERLLVSVSDVLEATRRVGVLCQGQEPESEPLTKVKKRVRKIPPVRLPYDATAERVYRALLSGVLYSHRLAQELGLSRNTIGNKLRRLASEGRAIQVRRGVASRWEAVR